jgi:TonB family protein
MSAATSLALEKTPRRVCPRHPIDVPLDLIVLRSGVPENLPGRCTDISEAGVGAVIAGELVAGQQVAVDLRLPNVGVPVRARALVRYQSKFRCGLEFVGLPTEQREMIRYWVYRSSSQPMNSKDFKREEKIEPASAEKVAGAVEPVVSGRKIRLGRRGLFLLIACVLALGGLGWWQWQKFWSELENRTPSSESELRVSPETRVSAETMDKRIVTKVDPIYPEAARTSGTEGLVVLDAVIAQDGSVRKLRPLSGSDPLVQSALDAVRSWKFEPYLASGKPIEVETTIAVDFELN